ncbi:MAG: PIN domain-containing protein [Candidatus Woesearchaeota archaeon]|nr:PIN domain-containing protein [Candidatus Woesearchaeota archaeon]
MSDLLLDSSAWIEYLGGTKKGKEVQALIENKRIYIIATTVAEVCSKALKDTGTIARATLAMRTRGVFLPLTFEIGEQTAHIYVKERKKKPKFGLADAQTYAAAKNMHATLITCDHDFAKMSHAIVIA